MASAPKDCNQRIIGSKARGIVHYKFPKEHCVFVNKKVLQKGSKKVSTFNTQ